MESSKQAARALIKTCLTFTTRLYVTRYFYVIIIFRLPQKRMCGLQPPPSYNVTRGAEQLAVFEAARRLRCSGVWKRFRGFVPVHAS